MSQLEFVFLQLGCTQCENWIWLDTTEKMASRYVPCNVCGFQKHNPWYDPTANDTVSEEAVEEEPITISEVQHEQDEETKASTDYSCPKCSGVSLVTDIKYQHGKRQIVAKCNSCRLRFLAHEEGLVA